MVPLVWHVRTLDYVVDSFHGDPNGIIKIKMTFGVYQSIFNLLSSYQSITNILTPSTSRLVHEATNVSVNPGPSTSSLFCPECS
jgi:hypothetical protein